jgi:hypothetical protein
MENGYPLALKTMKTKEKGSYWQSRSLGYRRWWKCEDHDERELKKGGGGG